MLNELKCHHSKPLAKRYRLADERGMYLEVHPNGSRYFRLKYRFEGKEKRLALGVYPDVSLREARDLRDEARKCLKQGIDPSAARKVRKVSSAIAVTNAFESVAREWHLKQHATWTLKHSGQVLKSLEQDIFPFLGERQISDLQAPDLLPVFQRIEQRGALEIAKRIMQRCAAVFRYGVATGKCSRNPVTDLEGALEQPRKQGMAAVMPREVPELLRKIREYPGHRLTLLALELLALTFVRTTELIEARWSEIDIDAGEWRIPAARMKMREHHIVPLSSQARALFREVKVLTGESEFVFCNQSDLGRPMSNNTLLYALYRMGYRGRMTGHGFRVVASTILNEMGFRPDIIERQLAHTERNKVRSAYNRAEYIEDRKQMMQGWGNHLDALRDGAKVIPIAQMR